MLNNERFERVYSQGVLCVMEIWVDKETGVNYLFHHDGHAGGMTTLLDKDGKPIVTPNSND
ncbi:MAG: xylan 1,4-beta-xylosidase [Clostridia bacterium]|nr:xylan 1,4-beta-xylosidase [Clostridia bacterium]